MLLPRAVLDRLGPMDEDYFLYFEETDWQLRAARAGLEVWYVPEARFFHLEGALTGQGSAARDESAVPDYWFRSRRRYFEKNHGAAYADRADRAWLAATRFYLLRQRLLRRSDGGRSLALGRFLANRGQPGSGAPGEAQQETLA
jgi:GT2 family glycosyltransferase